ncbi:MAG: VWA domain-containing protein [Clostridia bacterium]|nr:VWA domain-containing protein [Clostridia bacterium]
MEKKQRKTKLIGGIIALIIIAGIICIVSFAIKNNKKISNIVTGKKDDWEFNTNSKYIESGTTNSKSTLQAQSLTSTTDTAGFGATSNGKSLFNAGSSMDYASTSTESTIGFSTGGAKDVENFRKNIEKGYFPISTDITYNGIFYDYTFDTGRKNESKELFSPSYSTAISKDPISGKSEYYITVGLNSNIKESDFKRKKLNLVVVLDISGSMGATFDSYYYDSSNQKNEDSKKTKMQIANESVNILIDQLKDDDRFGMVLFDDKAYLGKQLSLIENTDVEAIKNHILEIQDAGGTNFESGYTKATELFREYKNIDSSEYENRIIVITDAMPNTGNTSDKGLLSYVKKNATDGIYTTFIGVGVDFNTKLIETISDVKGANYYSVHSSNEFKERMGEQFEYMVTPLVFDLNLNLKSEDYEIQTVYGSDTVNKENGNIMSVNTLFPSKSTTTGEVKGGVVLLKLKKKNSNNLGSLKLDVSYKDRNGKEFSNSQTVEFNNSEEYYENTGIRKAIVLTRYVNALKNWILFERTENEKFVIEPMDGIVDCVYTESEIYKILGEHERTSVSLKVSANYKEIFKKLKQYILDENNFINDTSLNQEIEILDRLIER